ncbi:MAG: DNA mismatch repair protein MutS [Bacteroidota bacterium]
MQDPNTFYNTQVERFTKEAKVLQRQLVSFSIYRVVVFLITAIALYYTFSIWQVAVGIAILGAAVFLWLLSRYTDIKAKRDLTRALISINTNEIIIGKGDFHKRDSGLEFQNAKHHYSLDLDLFGRGSLFQYINRTAIKTGKAKLADAMRANTISEITQRQKAIKELASKMDWCQRYSATASLIEVDTPANTITSWLQHYKSFIPHYFKWTPVVFSIVSIAILVLTIFSITPPAWLGYWLLIGLGITGIYLKAINQLAHNTSKAKDTFRQYATLLDMIEQEAFSSELLKSRQQQINTDANTASAIFKEFSKALDALDNRNNLLSAVLGNGYVLWDIMQAYRIESWIRRYAEKVEDWFEVVAFFDAYISLGTFGFNHQEFLYPEIKASGATINAKDLGHPLISKDKRITSDLRMERDEFFIVTGANMAGKSTFLRTVSLHVVMGNMGLPVCASSSEYHPIKLITSMRTSDSLADESSYFFSELTRLKFIVDAIKADRYFIVLDEILKGTNSTDKAIGSRKFVEQLVAANATGIIATHDLSLCAIEAELEPVKNYYFDAEIVNDELYFDYKLKEGVCKNMNASFLLKKMKIVN